MVFLEHHNRVFTQHCGILYHVLEPCFTFLADGSDISSPTCCWGYVEVELSASVSHLDRITSSIFVPAWNIPNVIVWKIPQLRGSCTIAYESRRIANGTCLIF
ncbi:hypothetical protein Droror1_Dr00000657 [Drosera rotundifolia]